MNNKLFLEMVKYYQNDSHQIQHLLKVTAFALRIAEEEGIDEKTTFILEASALVHDIGIKKSLEIYGDDKGFHQEALGPALAKDMMGKLGYGNDVIERVAYLVGHHHTYTEITGIDYQILVEADSLVNCHEGNKSKEYISNVKNTIFKTKMGISILNTMFGLE